MAQITRMELVEELDAIKRAERRAGLAQQATEPKFFTEGSGGNEESEEKTGKRQPQRAQRSQSSGKAKAVEEELPMFRK